MRNGEVPSSADPIATETLGFEDCPGGWRKTVGGRPLRFARLRSRLDLTETERLQQTVFGVSDRDLISSSILVTVHETGGEVIGALDGQRLVGFVSGWGGYVDGRPRIVSDLMAVEAGYRGGCRGYPKGAPSRCRFTGRLRGDSVDGRSIAGCECASELRASGRLRAQVPTERIRGRLRGRPLRGSSK